MAEAPIDAETLAAFIDGTLDEEERERVLALLAGSDSSYEALVEAAAVLQELDRVGSSDPRGPRQPDAAPAHTVERNPNPAGQPEVLSKRTQRFRRWTLSAPFLVAAGVAGLMVLSRQRDRTDILSLLDDVVSEGGVADLPPVTAWVHGTWPGSRGPNQALPARVRSVRLGAQATDLELAFRLRDTSLARSVAANLAAIASSTGAGVAVGVQTEHLARDSIAAPRQSRSRLATELRSLSTPAEWFDLGAWCEAARLAARAGELDFFQPEKGHGQQLLDLLGRIERLPIAERTGTDSSLTHLQRLAGRRIASPQELAEVLAVLDSTLIDLGR